MSLLSNYMYKLIPIHSYQDSWQGRVFVFLFCLSDFCLNVFVDVSFLLLFLGWHFCVCRNMSADSCYLNSVIFACIGFILFSTVFFLFMVYHSVENCNRLFSVLLFLFCSLQYNITSFQNSLVVYLLLIFTYLCSFICLLAYVSNKRICHLLPSILNKMCVCVYRCVERRTYLIVL